MNDVDEVIANLKTAEELKLAAKKAEIEKKLSKEMAQKKALARIENLKTEIDQKLNKMTKIAEEYGVEFDWNGPRQYLNYIPETAEKIDDDWYSSNTGWTTSSDYC